MRNTQLTLLIAAAGLVAASSAKASIEVTFDATDSNIAAGIYAFDLSGVTQTPTFNSTFELLNWDNPTGVHNSLNPLVDKGSPSGWGSEAFTIGVAEWVYSSGADNGTFEVKATPDLSGVLNWNLAVPGINSETVNGTVTIPAIPEPGTFAAGFAALTGAILLPLKRNRAA